MRLLLGFILFCSSYSFASDGALLDPLVKEEVERVCGFCHFYDFLDEETELLSFDKILKFRLEMIRRLSLKEGEEGRMPPSRSSLTLSDTAREEFLVYLKGLEVPEDR